MRWTASTAEDTEAFGASLAKSRPAEAALCVVYLSGDLGAGKTTLTRGFLRQSGVSGRVKSPTYTLVESYPTAAITFLHLDLYRLTQPGELENLGLRDWAQAGYLWLVEWPERGAGYLPEADLVLQLTAGSDRHFIEAIAATPTGRAWLATLEAVVNPQPQS